jgi:ComF family protein
LSGNRKQAYLQHNKYNMSIIEKILALVAPHLCLGCSKEGALLCEKCLSDLAMIPPRCYNCQRLTDDFLTCPACRKHTPLARVWAYTPYKGLAKEVIHKIKFERAQAGARTVARALAGVYTGSDQITITNIPTANSRVRQRGYDQAALIAQELARLLHCKYTTLLARVGEARQVGQQRNVRKMQMHDAFRLSVPALGSPESVLLVDDVLTTGATCEAAARVLRQAGVKHVEAIVFAVA